ncbi:LOW QUALITY PROTEIN: B-cell lymphoma 3 protein homolog, partial [Camarhynchus parvulus]|uniref:LOW QUALITY PROTEIN: B-cell lymphoma 3 protein homolog n=1 Tax=Geospiza parvula TaxID=87175 RepID=UPI001237B068
MAEELPVDLRTRRTPNAPRAPQKRRPSPTPEASLPLRKRRSVLGGGGGRGDPRILGEPLPNPHIRPPPKIGVGTGETPSGSRAEPPLPFFGAGGILGVPPALLASPNFGVPPEPPLAAAIAAATRQDEDGDTPLHIAVAQGALAVARRLVALFLRGGRDLDVYNHLRQTPLHLAVITGQVSLLRLLLAHGASPMCPHLYPLHVAVITGQTPLHLAVITGQVSLLRLLLAHGASPIPLHLAVITGQVSLLRLLLAHGASPMCPDRLGRTCAHLACGSHLPGGGATAGPRPRVLRELLRSPGGSRLDLQARDYEGLTPLHVAVASGSRESVLLLLEHGADVDAGDIKSGRSPLLHAVENDSLEMAELLLQHGTSVNAQSYAGCTALHSRRGGGLLRLLRLLLRCGADCGLRNLHNDTAAAVAVSAQVIDILRGKASRPPQDPPKSPRDPPH